MKTIGRGARRAFGVRVSRIGLAALLLAYGAGAARAGDDAAGPSVKDRFAKAWLALEVDRDPATATPGFQSVVADESAPREMRARASLGLARCERLLGKSADAERRLRALVEQYADLGAVLTEARQALADAAGGRSRYITGVVSLAQGQWLDLDTGGVFSGPGTFDGHLAEVGRDVKGVSLPAGHAADAAFAALLPVWSKAPWERISTDEGRVGWVQVLSNGSPSAVRFVTRTSGAGDVVLPSADPVVGLGTPEGIAVHFAVNPAFARYRVERRVGTRAAYAAVAEVETSPYLDPKTEEGTRYGYRIVGIAADASEGIPAVVQATRGSFGVVAGSCDLSRGTDRAWDVLRSLRADLEDGDVFLANTFGGGDGASFVGGDDQPVVQAEASGTELRSIWAAPARERFPYVQAGRWFTAPVRGGGVYRARFTEPAKGRGEAHLDYEAYPDGPVFPVAPVLVASRVPEGVRITLQAPAGFAVHELTARTLDVDGPARRIDVQDGSAVDAAPAAGHVTSYAARGVDALGRSGTTGEVVWNDRPRGVVSGEFTFHYQQGYSFDRAAVVPVEEADVVFSGAAGGISSITLSAPGGIVGLEHAHTVQQLEVAKGASRVQRVPISAQILFDAVRAVDPVTVRLLPTAHGDARRPDSDVFIVRTRHGGWAKLAIVRRGTEGGWHENLATVQFAYNAFEPTFGPATYDVAKYAGVVLEDPSRLLEQRRNERMGDLAKGLRSGTFQFHYGQGYSFEKGALATSEDADIIFASAAGGITSVSLAAPGGIAALETRIHVNSVAEQTPKAVRTLFAQLVQVDPARVGWKDIVTADDRAAGTEVFVVRTRSGAWAKAALVDRASEGAWTERPVTVEFVLSRDAPRFAEKPTESYLITVAGFTLAMPRVKSVPVPSTVPAPARSDRAAWEKLHAHLISIPSSGKEVEVGEIIRLLAVSTEMNFIVSPEVKGKVDVPFENVPADLVLDALAEKAGFRWEIAEFGVIRILPKEETKTPK